MKKIITGIFCCFLLVASSAYLFVRGPDFSELENRTLARFPALSVKSVAEGEFQTGLESYMNDRFLMRDQMVRLSACFTYISGRHEKNGSYILPGGRFIQKLEGVNEQAAFMNADAIREFAEMSRVQVYMALLPGAADVYAAELPYGAPNADQLGMINKLYERAEALDLPRAAGLMADAMKHARLVDIAGAMYEHSDEYIYYNTDHHWTSLGAYYGYRECVSAMGITPVPLESLERKTLSDEFLGTLYSDAPVYWAKMDEVDAYASDAGVSLSVFDGRETREGELYVMDRLLEKNKYTVFLGGNQPLIVINGPNADAPKLLVLRDSYMDSAAPFFAAHFSQVHLLDPRYYKRSVSDYIDENGIDVVLICYGLKNFAESTNIALVLST